MASTQYHPALRTFAFATAILTLLLLVAGGLVTSHGVGMAVPDWPNTYGYNMFLFPVSKWLGGIFYEHTHRLIAAFTGLFTAILSGWLWVAETRGWRRWCGVGLTCAVLLLLGVRRMPVYLSIACVAPIVIVVAIGLAVRTPSEVRWWGVAALFAVTLQGVLGGLRVVWFKDEIGIFHATLAQLFFLAVCALAWRLSKFWPASIEPAPAVSRKVRPLYLTLAIFVFLQLILGATMRHQHAGLAIPDFPLAYHNLWPDISPEAVAGYNQHRIETAGENPITAVQIVLQMCHRGIALAIAVLVVLMLRNTRRLLPKGHSYRRVVWGLMGLVILQIFLGASTIWSNKAADVATAHLLVGALTLAGAGLLSFHAYLDSIFLPASERTVSKTGPATMPAPISMEAGRA